MIIKIISVGKKHDAYVEDGIKLFTQRIERRARLEWQLVPQSPIESAVAKEQEGDAVLGLIKPNDYVVLLDERGQQINSEDFADIIERSQNNAVHRLVYIIGGAYGASEKLQSRSNATISLGRQVMPHQLVRLVLSEQIYRAFTILSSEPYHHK